jgi:hypothetical protein
LEPKSLQEIKYEPYVLRFSEMFSAAWAAVFALNPPLMETEFTDKILTTLALDWLLDNAVANHADELID